MVIVFYTQNNPTTKVEKTLENGVVINGALRDRTSVLNPVVTIKSNEIPIYNYCYIPMFKRYYFITDIESVNNGLVKIECKVDVLTSFANEIKNSLAKTKTSMNGNEYYNGVEIGQEVRTITQQIDFPKSPFNENGEIILVAINGTGVV